MLRLFAWGVKRKRISYLSGWDHDSNLLDSLGKLLWLNGSVIVKIEILERFEKDGLLVLAAVSLLLKLGLKGLLETRDKARVNMRPDML